ncbi:MAG: Ig-like domain-containing protein [Bacteroidales bacterium]|nr:Ig-like domain-containing protein [Bacteroidales bacterium]
MKKLFIIAALGALVLTACKEEKKYHDAIGASSITLDCDNFEIPIGEQVLLKATVLPENIETPLRWLSDKPFVASVSEDGEVMAHNPGEATIIAVAGEASAICRVKVFRAITELSLGTEPIQILRKGTFLIQPQFQPEDATETIKWVSSNTDVATVDENGLVTGISEGLIVITAECYYTSADCSVEVSEVHATAISLSGPSEIWLGHEEPITATLTPSESTDDIEWSSSAPEVATVNKDGVVKGLALGNAEISASIGELTTSIQIEVIPVPVAEVVVEPPLATITVDETVQFSAIISPEDAADKAVVWSSGDESIATVDENGLVKGVAKGETLIYATSANGTYGQATVKVKSEVKTYTLPFIEDFESLNNETIRDEWTFFDVDGDDYGWVHILPDYAGSFATHSGTGSLASASYVNYVGALTPDNWVFTPPIKLDEADNVLSFYVAGQDGSYAKEHYAVYISTEISMSNGTRLVEGTVTEGTSYIYTKPSATGAPASGQYKPMDASPWENITVAIPDEFNGKVVYIAFRHFDITDMYWILLDDVSVTSSASETPAEPEPTEPAPAVYRAPRMSFPGFDAFKKIVR